MIDYEPLEVWFLTGSQHLYGDETLKQVARNSQQIAEALEAARMAAMPVAGEPVTVIASAPSLA